MERPNGLRNIAYRAWDRSSDGDRNVVYLYVLDEYDRNVWAKMVYLPTTDDGYFHLSFGADSTDIISFNEQRRATSFYRLEDADRYAREFLAFRIWGERPIAPPLSHIDSLHQLTRELHHNTENR